jgi:hypothetical protein
MPLLSRIARPRPQRCCGPVFAHWGKSFPGSCMVDSRPGSTGDLAGALNGRRISMADSRAVSGYACRDHGCDVGTNGNTRPEPNSFSEAAASFPGSTWTAMQAALHIPGRTPLAMLTKRHPARIQPLNSNLYLPRDSHAALKCLQSNYGTEHGHFLRMMRINRDG